MAYSSTEVLELLQQRAVLDDALAEARTKEVRLTLLEIVEKMREYDISLSELVGRTPEGPKTEIPIMYRDPVSGATWSGRGRPPQWIIGQDREGFLVAGKPASRLSLQGSLF